MQITAVVTALIKAVLLLFALLTALLHLQVLLDCESTVLMGVIYRRVVGRLHVRRGVVVLILVRAEVFVVALTVIQDLV
jgi:hypothetical protein